MTVEGQRYLEECRKVLKEEQIDTQFLWGWILVFLFRISEGS